MIDGFWVRLANIDGLLVEGNSGGIRSEIYEGDHEGKITNLTNARFINNDTSRVISNFSINSGDNIVFENNSAGAISTGWNDYVSTIRVGSISFINNSETRDDYRTASGGAISSSYGGLSFNATTSAYFSGNKVTHTNNGKAQGGAISSTGSLSVSGPNTTFLNNAARGGEARGGAIYGGGSLTVSNAHFEGNLASGNSAYGGAVHGSLSATNITFVNNHAIGSETGRGGALYSTGAVSLVNTSFSDNSASSYGGAMYMAGKNNTSTIRNTSITNNFAGAAGGGIYTEGSLTLTADAGQSTTIKGNSAAGRNDGIFMNTDGGNADRALTVSGEGTVNIADSVRAEGQKAVNFNKNGSGSLIWGQSNYFSNNSSFNFNEGKTTLTDNFSLQAENMSLNLAAEHSLYLDLTNRDRDTAYFSGLSNITVAKGSSLVLTFNGAEELTGHIDLGSWLFADLTAASAAVVSQLRNLDITLLVDGVTYVGAFFEVIDTGLWINMAGLATPIPGSILLLGTGVAALIRMRRRAA